jgi:hypothetical protein
MTAQDDTKEDGDQEKAFELELETLNVELATVRIERGKQRQQLEKLTQEQTQLQSTRERGMKRNQISGQLHDLGISVGQKERSKHRALEDLEQAKSHHRQLKRTLELLKGGVQDIVDRSSNDYLDTSIEGTRRAALRQELLKNIVRHNLKGLNLTAPQFTHHDDEDSEAEDIKEEADDKVIGLLGPTAGSPSTLSTASSSTNHSRHASARTRSIRSSDQSERNTGRNTPRRTRSEQVRSGKSSLGSIISHSSEQQRGRKAPARSQSEQSDIRSLVSSVEPSERSRSHSTKSRSSSSKRKSSCSNDRSERSPGQNIHRRTRSEQVKLDSSSLGSIISRKPPMRSQSEPRRTRSEQIRSGSSSMGSIISHSSEQQRGRRAPARSQNEQSDIRSLASSVEPSERSRSHSTKSRSSSSKQKSSRSNDRLERSPGQNIHRRTRSEQLKSESSSLGSIISHRSEQQRGRKPPLRSQNEQTDIRSLASSIEPSERSRSLSSKSRSPSSKRRSTRSKSAKRRRGQRKKKQQQQQEQQQATPNEENESLPIAAMTPRRPAAGPRSLFEMLERGGEDESTVSEGTPKTCNTRD